MSTNVLVPRLGEGVEEVTITKWLKQVGETVRELEPLLEVNTDKVDTEIPAPVSGVLKEIVLPEGQPAQVGQVLAVLETAGEAAAGASAAPSEQEALSAPAPAAGGPEPKQASSLAGRSSREGGFLSPVVAKIAAEEGINLAEVTGSGLHGRITKQDVLDFVEKRRQQAAAALSPSLSAPTRPAVQAVPPVAPSSLGAEDALVAHSAIRRSIARHMVESKHTSPHVLTVMEADLSRALAHRAANKENFARDGVNLTLTAYFMLALVAALKAYPQVNSSWSEEGLVLHKYIHLGMATSLGEDGLIVPVIKHAENLSLLGMARAVNDLAARARARKLLPEEVKGGTFTLTNHGISGSLFAFPVINQPQCGILGVGALQKRVIVQTDEVGHDSLAIRPMVYLSFVFDHRILDGASADWFLMKVKQTLETGF